MSYTYVPYNDSAVKILSPPAADGTPAKQVDENFSALVDADADAAAALAAHTQATTAAHGGLQPSNSNLTSIAALPTTVGFVKQTSAHTFAVATPSALSTTVEWPALPDDITITAGGTYEAPGGSVHMSAGIGDPGGDISIAAGDGATYGRAGGSIILALGQGIAQPNGNLLFVNLPASDPHVLWAIYYDPATHALKISAG